MNEDSTSECSLRRRAFLGTTLSTTIVGVSGCLRLGGADSNTETATNAPTETPIDTPAETPTDTPTDTPSETPQSVQVPEDASFSFDYSGGSLTIRLMDGGPIPAANLVVQSSDGTEAHWHELGSTAVPASGSVTSGDTATIDSSVLNWSRSVEQSETVRLVFLLEEGSPTTLDMFAPSAEEPPTQSGDTIFEEDFEDGEYTDTFDVKRQQSDTSIDVTGENPRNGDRSLTLRVGSTGQGDLALQRTFSQESGVLRYTAWIYPNSENHNIHFNFSGPDGNADISFNAAQQLIYRTDQDINADRRDHFGNPILHEHPDVNRWYRTSITAYLSQDTVDFEVTDSTGNEWTETSVPATTDFERVRIGGSDYHGNYTFYVDDISLSIK